jgi:DNA-binding GntR family transcriptional regulator
MPAVRLHTAHLVTKPIVKFHRRGRAALTPPLPVLSAPAPGKPTNGFAVPKLQRNTLNDEVYEQLKRALSVGAIAPGSTMTIRSLAKSFGISPMPVREALGRLASDHALVVLPNRSVAVPVMTRDRFHEVTQIRLLLEGLAAEEGARRVSRVDIEFMAVADELMEAGGSVEDYLTKNREFHFTLYRSAGMPTLFKMIESLWLQIGPLLRTFREAAPEQPRWVLMHHRQVLRALRKQDPAGVRKAMLAHIREGADLIERTLSPAW